MSKMSPMDMLNNIRKKAKLDDINDFSKSIAIRLKAGKIKLQLVALDSDHLFRSRTQHMIPTIPNEDDKNEKWLIADCKGDSCPICTAATAFKNSGITLEEVNGAYNPKYPYKSLRAVFTQPEHYLLCARVLADNADDGSYLPKDAELGSTHLIQFSRMALNNLMSAYEDFMDDFDGDEDEEVPPLFAVFDGKNTAKSLTITCRVTMQPYSCNFAFNKIAEITLNDVDSDKLKLLAEVKEVPEEHYEKCVKRIKAIQNYFVAPFTEMEDLDSAKITASKTVAAKGTEKPSFDTEDDELNIDDLL